MNPFICRRMPVLSSAPPDIMDIMGSFSVKKNFVLKKTRNTLFLKEVPWINLLWPVPLKTEQALQENKPEKHTVISIRDKLWTAIHGGKRNQKTCKNGLSSSSGQFCGVCFALDYVGCRTDKGIAMANRIVLNTISYHGNIEDDDYNQK